MKVSQISNQQSFQGGAMAYHSAKKKAFYGIAAGCALMAATCGFSYAKDANPNGYRSSTHTAKQMNAKDILLVMSSIAGLVGSLFSLKKADDERELEDLYKVKENIKNKKHQNDFAYIETRDEERSKKVNPANSIENNKIKYFTMYRK